MKGAAGPSNGKADPGMETSFEVMSGMSVLDDIGFSFADGVGSQVELMGGG